jgi:peptidoglycan hydrolase CwlO-like protein
MDLLSDITIADVAALVVAIAAFIRVFWITPSDKVHDDLTRVDIAEKYQDMHAQALQTIEQMRVKLNNEILAREKFENELKDLQGQIDSLRNAIKFRDEIIEEWREGICLLTEQIENELNSTPSWKPKDWKLNNGGKNDS